LKSKLLISLLLFLVFTPAFAVPLSDKTGLVNRLDVKAGGQEFEVQTVANFDVQNFKFDEEQKRLTLYIVSSLEDNLGEVIIPLEFLSGNFTFYLNDQQYFPNVRLNDRISFITLNFTGSGDNKLDIIGTDYLKKLNETSIIPIQNETSIIPIQNKTSSKGGCLIATATFGSELAPQVQQLRELRDNKLLESESGTLFMNSFNALYYSFSPTIADYERENPLFKEVVKIALTPMISSLSILNYVNMDSEVTVLAYGAGILALNLGMYFVAPAVLVVRLNKLRKQK
jgi:hypothetical protein